MLSSRTPSWCLGSSAPWSCKPGRREGAGRGGGKLRRAAFLNTGVHFPSRSQEEMISWIQVSECSRAPRFVTLPTQAEGKEGVHICVCGGGREGRSCVCARTRVHGPSCCSLFLLRSCSVAVWRVRPEFKSCCLSLPGWVVWDKSLNIPEPQFSHL